MRLLDGETLKPLLQHELVQQIRSPHFPIPELEDGFRYDHWSGGELKLRVGGNISSFEAYYRLRGKHPGNRWAFKRTPLRSSLNLEPWRLDQYLFRGDIWVFKVNLESPLYYQDIGDASPEDLDYFNFRFPVSDDRRDTAQKEISLFWDERKKEIERKLILYLIECEHNNNIRWSSHDICVGPTLGARLSTRSRARLIHQHPHSAVLYD